MTRNAAHALGLPHIGALEPARWRELAIWDVDRPAELVSNIGPRRRFIGASRRGA